MSTALIFGSSALDFQDIRTNVIRIPEVIHTIREAQSIWDALNGEGVDLVNFIGSEDHIFLSQIKMKNFATAVVQTGLYRRYLRRQPHPDYLIGTVNGDSPLRVALEQISFVEMVGESEAIPRERLQLVPNEDVLLSGVRLDEYAVYGLAETGKYRKISFDSRDVIQMVDGLATTHGLDRVIFVGPGTWSKISARVEVAETIDLDPALAWFWGPTKENRIAVAN